MPYGLVVSATQARGSDNRPEREHNGTPRRTTPLAEQAALKCLYLVTRSLDPTGTGRTKWAVRWKPALNAFAITFGDRFPAAETY